MTGLDVFALIVLLVLIAAVVGICVILGMMPGKIAAKRKHPQIEPGSPWENGYNESFNGKLRDEVLNREIFYNIKEARVVVENWRKEYNTVRPQSSLDYRPPAPKAVQPLTFEPIWFTSDRNNTPQFLT